MSKVIRLTTSSRDYTLRPLTSSEERRRTGRYVAGGTALAVMLLALHHVLLRGASTIAGICIPAIIMFVYVIWVLYSVRRDRQKALRRASAIQLMHVVSSSPGIAQPIRNSVSEMDQPKKEPRDIT